MKTQPATLDLIQKLFAQNFSESDDENSLLDQLSSLELVHLVTELEKHFQINIQALEINEKSFQNLRTVAELVDRKKTS